MKCGRGCHQGTGWEKVWSGRRVLVTSRWDSRRSPACLPAEAARFAGLGASHPWVYLTLGDLPPPKLLGFSRLPFPFSKSLTAAPLDAPGHRGCSGIVSWIPEIRLSESRPAILEEIAVQTVLKIHVSILLPCLSGAPLAQVLYMNNLTSNFYLESTAREKCRRNLCLSRYCSVMESFSCRQILFSIGALSVSFPGLFCFFILRSRV